MNPIRIGPVLLFLFLSACHATPPTPSDTLIVGIESSPQFPHDPRRSMTDAYSSKISDLVFNGLFQVNERMEIVPDLADSVETLSPTRFRIQLKKGVLFHNGRPLTAGDVQKTLERIQDPQTLSPQLATLSVIRSVKALEDHLLEIVLKSPYAPLWNELRFGILPEGIETGVGTGPYRLVEFVPEERVVLESNAHYFGRPPKPRRLLFRVVPDENTRVLELLSGRLDFLQNNVPPPLVAHLHQKKGFQLVTTEGINYTYLGLNLKVPPTSDPRVRQAIAHALDLPAIIAYRLGGLAQPARGLLSTVHWAYEPDTPFYPYNPAESRRLLDEAGYPDPDRDGPEMRFHLTYKTSNRKDRIGLARLFARYLREVGIGVKVLPYEWGTFFRDIQAGNFQIYSLTWVGIVHPDIYHYILHSSRTPPNGANRSSYANPIIDRLLDEARLTSDRQKGVELYSLVQKILSQDLPIISLWHETNYALFSKRVKRVRLRPDAGFQILSEVEKE